MELHYGAVNINRLSRDSGVGLGTVARLKGTDHSIGLDKVDKLAAVFKVEAWQLLDPSFDPTVKKPAAGSSFSPMATRIASEFDSIADAQRQAMAFALVTNALDLASLPAGAPAAQGHAPSRLPVSHP